MRANLHALNADQHVHIHSLIQPGSQDLQELFSRRPQSKVHLANDTSVGIGYAYGGVRLCKAWEAMPQITIAAMEKLAVGAGVAIALAYNRRVLGRNAYLYVPEVKIGLNLQWGALPRLITLVGPARAKRITIMCEKMPAAQALDWGLVEELADDGRTVEKALEMAEVVLSMPAPTVRMIKEAVNATANALHAATAFADADQSQLTATYRSAKAAPELARRSRAARRIAS